MQIATYGAWTSSLTPELLASGLVRYGFTSLGADGALYWTESRPAEQGRSVIVRRSPDGTTSDLLPAPHSARTRVHEYGGRSMVLGDEQLWFVQQSDQQLYALSAAGEVSQLTAASDTRFAEPIYERKRQRLIAVAERHAADGSVSNFLAAIDLRTGQVTTLISGRAFYASPALAPDGSALAYLAWDHPNMPWDAADLNLLPLDAQGEPTESRHIAGGSDASALQPTWSPGGQLYFTLEDQGLWALHRLREGAIEKVTELTGELGAPLWQLGTELWGFADADTILGVTVERGASRIVEISVATGRSRVLSDALPYVGQLIAAPDAAFITLGWTGSGSEIVRVSAAGNTSIRCAHEGLLADEDSASAQAISFETSHGEQAHGFFYAPKNHAYRAPEGARPPLVVLVHGGPTAGAAATFNATVQYFTTRGYAVFDVNYRGSSGYGRAYRDRLRGEWGVLDVDDCVAGARYLAQSGRVDAQRMIIRGGSAGGYTVLQALANHDVFAAGSCHYGISDLEALTRDTHKFESHYDRYLIGPYPERRDLFIARSPIHYVERITKPVIFFQGDDDRVVPADQTQRMALTLRERGIETEYHAYAGEQHGFRKADTIQHVLRSEQVFLRRVLSI